MDKQIDFIVSKKRGFSIWPHVLLMLLVVALFWDCFFLGKVVCLRDLFCDGLPWRQFTRQAFLEGAIPLWNPYSSFGQPFLADPQTAVLYPLHLLFILFSPAWALTVSLSLHLLISAWSMFALARHWRMDNSPALLAAVSWTFSTYFIVQLEFHSVLCAMAWMPLSLLLVSRMLERLLRDADNKKWGELIQSVIPHIFAITVVFAVQYLAGNPQPFFFTLILVSAYVWLQLIRLRNPKVFFVGLAGLTVSGIATILLVMPQLLPTLELIPLSIRSTDIDPELNFASVHWRHLSTLIFPFIFGEPGYSDLWWGDRFSLFEYWLGACHIGIIPLIFASFAPLYAIYSGKHPKLKSPRFLILFLAGVMFIGWGLALGKNAPIYMFFFDHIPGFDRFRWPAKAIQLAVFSMSLLAGFGFQGIINRPQRLTGFGKVLFATVFGLWLVIFSGLASGWLSPAIASSFFQAITGGVLAAENIPMTKLHGDFARAVIFAAVGCASVLIPFIRKNEAASIGLMVVLICYVNLFIVDRRLFFGIDRQIIEKPAPSSHIRAYINEQPYRTHSLYAEVQQFLYGSRDGELFRWAKMASVGEASLPEKIFKTWGGGALRIQESVEVYGLMETLPPWQRERLADILNIRHLVFGDPFTYIQTGEAPRAVDYAERPHALPRAFLAYHWRIIPDWRNALGYLLSTAAKPSDMITLESTPSNWNSIADQGQEYAIGGQADLSSGIQQLQYDWNRIRLQAVTDRRAILVLNEIWYPGWTVRVDGEKKTTLRANGLFHGVALEPGNHEVEFSYRPFRFRAGCYVSGVIILVMISVLFLNHRKGVQKGSEGLCLG